MRSLTINLTAASIAACRNVFSVSDSGSFFLCSPRLGLFVPDMVVVVMVLAVAWLVVIAEDNVYCVCRVQLVDQEHETESQFNHEHEKLHPNPSHADPLAHGLHARNMSCLTSVEIHQNC